METTKRSQQQSNKISFFLNALLIGARRKAKIANSLMKSEIHFRDSLLQINQMSVRHRFMSIFSCGNFVLFSISLTTDVSRLFSRSNCIRCYLPFCSSLLLLLFYCVHETDLRKRLAKCKKSKIKFKCLWYLSMRAYESVFSRYFV